IKQVGGKQVGLGAKNGHDGYCEASPGESIQSVRHHARARHLKEIIHIVAKPARILNPAKARREAPSMDPSRAITDEYPLGEYAGAIFLRAAEGDFDSYLVVGFGVRATATLDAHGDHEIPPGC